MEVMQEMPVLFTTFRFLNISGDHNEKNFYRLFWYNLDYMVSIYKCHTWSITAI